MKIEKDMNIVVHPTYMRGGMLSWFCDNYLIGPNGPGERLHHFFRSNRQIQIMPRQG